MSRFTDQDDVLVNDPEGEMSYEDAVSHVVDTVVAAFEELIWNLVDDLEYLAEAEYDEPTTDDNEDEPEVE